jgi:hypothetical protein
VSGAGKLFTQVPKLVPGIKLCRCRFFSEFHYLEKNIYYLEKNTTVIQARRS